MKNQHNTNSSSGRFTTDTTQRENEQTTRSFTMRNMGRGLLLGLSLSIAAFSVATAQTGSLQGRRVILNDGGTTTSTFNRIQLNTPADGSLTGDYNLILPPSNGVVDNILFVESIPSAGNSQLNFTAGDHIFWKLKGNTAVFVDGTNNLLGTLTADPLNIITGGATRLRVTAAGNVGIGAGNAPSQLFAVGGGAGGNLTINNAGDIVTAGNATINGAATNTIGVAATTNNILGTTTVTGNALVNNSGAFTTGIGAGTNSGLVTIGNNANGGGVTVSAGTTNLVLNNILSAVPAPTDFTVWMTAVGNNVRRTLLSGTADQGLMFQAGQYRLGASGPDVNPIVSSRVVTVGALGQLAFVTAGGANQMLTFNNTGFVELNITGGAGTNIGTVGAGTVAVRGASITGTAPVMSSTSTTSNDINAATLTLNSTNLYNTNVGNANGTFGLTSTQLNIASATGNISDVVGNVVVADNLDVTGTGTNNIGVAATTNLILGSTTANGAAIINNASTFTTDIATGANSGLVTIGNNANGGGVTVSAGTTNLVLNNITIATPAVTDYNLWITGVGNNVRRQLLSGTADQGLMFEAGQYRLGNSTDGNTPIVSSRFVRVGAAGTLTFNTATTTALVINNGGQVDLNNVGGANTNIGTSGSGTITLGGATINATGNTTINSSGAFTTNVATGTNSGLTTIGNTAVTSGGLNLFAGGTSPITINPGVNTNNVVMNNIATGVNSNDVLLINGSNQVRRLASNQFAWLITGNGHFVTDNLNNLLGTTTAADLRVITNGATRMVVNGTGGAVAIGNIGIGTSADATYRLAIAPNATGNGVLVTGAPVTGLRIENPSGTGISVGEASAPITGIIVQAATTGMIIGSVTPPTTGIQVRATTNGITVNTGGGALMTINENSITRAGNIAINPGAANLVTTDGNVTISGANTNTIGVAATTNNITGTQNVVGLTNINAGAGTANTFIGNTGAGAGTVTIASGGTNATTIDVGNVGNNLVLNNINSVAPIDDILWITTGTNRVRRTPFTGTANEGIQFASSAYRLGASAVDVNPIVSTRTVTVGALGTLNFVTATGTNTMLQLNNNGVVNLNTVGGANTNIGTTGSGTITVGGSVINTTAPTMTSTSTTSNTINAATLTLNNTATYNTAIGNNTGTFTLASDQFRVAVNGDLSDAGGNVIVADNLDVTGTGTNNIGVAATTNLILGSTTANGTAIVNNASTFTTSIATGTNSGLVTIGNNANGGGITMSAGTTNIVMNNVTSATPGASDDILWITNVGNNVRRTGFSGMANEGVQYQNSAFRLGSSAVDVNPIVSTRTVTVGAAGTLNFVTATGTNTMLQLNNNGVVNLNTVGGANTNIGTAGSGTITVGASVINVTAPTRTSTSTTSNTINAATLTLNSTAGYNTAVGNLTGTFGLTSTQLNVASASGELSDLVGAVTVNDADGFVVNTAAGNDLTITETAITRAGALLVDQGAAATLTLGNTAGTTTIAGVSGTPNITATSLASNSLPIFVHPTDGIVVSNGSGVLRRRPVTDLINASNGVIYNETGTDAEVRLGTLAAGTGLLTNALAGPRFVNLGLAGVLSFNRGAGTDNMLSLNSATDVVTIDGATTNINIATGNTVVGNGAGTFGLTSTQLNVASATGFLTDAVGAVTVDDVDGLVINTGVPTDLVITETTISRVNADININPGGGNILRTDGSMTVDRNLIVDQTTNLGNGSGADHTTIAAGTGTITLTGATIINTTGSGQTTIGDLANSSAVNVRSQTAVNLLSDGNVNIQTSGNGDVVIGNSPTTQTLTINADIRGSGPNKFAERVIVNGTGVAAYTIANGLATANSVILVTLESYSGAGILSYQITNRAATSFTITFSNNILLTETVAVHYMIINP